MYTVKQTSKALGISDATLRIWGKRYEDHLSPGANPDKGKERKYTEEDILALNTVKVLRSQDEGFDWIEDSLADGIRLEPTEKPTEDESPPASKGTALQTQAFTEAMRAYEIRLDSIQEDLKAEREARLAAEIRATAAETELRVLKEVTDQKTPEGEKSGFWARLFNRG